MIVDIRIKPPKRRGQYYPRSFFTGQGAYMQSKGTFIAENVKGTKPKLYKGPRMK